MKKKTNKAYHLTNEPPVISEPTFEYYTPKKPSIQKAPVQELLLKDFLYQDFRSVANKAPFSLAEWADMLHISERTLQRYAKENTAFNGLQVELILLADKMLEMGNSFLGKEGFKEWIHMPAFSLGNQPPKSLFNSYAGIQSVINLIGRLQHGISA
jgi:putative toxin-antitoxin system antitoxin component (TIGR02293 family)